ncbi:ankyrin [Angomonas deanei]|nr:ankyrin [Angomonas deanei]|eukprot:EPY43552.1 ankyrin [Angomonas deanei]
MLDAVRLAVVEGSLDTLGRLSKDFLAVHDNISKCIDESGNTIVHLALGKSTATLQFVIDELHANVNTTNFQGRTPLHEAVTRNYVECCEVLLDNGADDSIQSSTLSTPFHTAAACGSVECMDVLLKRSADAAAKVNELDKNKSSALHKCAFDGDVRVSRWLVEHGATVDTADNQGVTPLLVAVKMGQRSVVEYLLSQGADSNRRDAQGNTCVHFSSMRCDTTVLKMLIDAGASTKVQNNEFNTPLHLTALYQRPDSKEWEELIALLLKSGCDPNVENASRKKAADYVNRGLKKLFTMEEVAHREQLEQEVTQQMEKDRRAAEQLRDAWAQKIQAELQLEKQLELEEEERLNTEAKEGLRADEDARGKLDSTIEILRHKEEEMKRLKALAEKAQGGGK